MAEETGAPIVAYEAVVGGKTIRFRRKLTAAYAPDLLGIFMEINNRDANTLIAFACRVIESWDLPGDPCDPATYADMDIIDELAPISDAATTYFSQRMDRYNALKN